MAVLKMFEICKKNLARESRELVELKTSKFKLFRKMHFVTPLLYFLTAAIFKDWKTYPKTKM